MSKLIHEAQATETKEELIKKVSSWYHSFDFGEGILIHGKSTFGVQTLLTSIIPQNLKGMSVLDVDARDGYYSFLCERLGAKVTAVNWSTWNNLGFEVAKQIFNSKVDLLQIELFDLPKLQKQFDLVLLFDSLLELRAPLRALEILHKVTLGRLILETPYYKNEGGEEISTMRFWPEKKQNNQQILWGPNIHCLLDMTEVAGFLDSRLHGTYYDNDEGGRAIIQCNRGLLDPP